MFRLRSLGCLCSLCALLLGPSRQAFADASSEEAAGDLAAIGSAVEDHQKRIRSGRWRNTAIALGVIAFGVIAVLAAGSNASDDGCGNDCASSS